MLQCHVLSTNWTLKSTGAALWPYYVCLQDVSVFEPWKCNSRLFISCDIHLLAFKFRVRLRKSWYLYASMYLADKSKVYKTREFSLWLLQSLLHIIGVDYDGFFSVFFVVAVFVQNLHLYLKVPGKCTLSKWLCKLYFLPLVFPLMSQFEKNFPSFTVHYLWNVFQQEVSIFPNNDQISKDKKLRSHFPLSVVHTDMFVQGLLWLSSLPTYFAAVLKCVRKMDAFYVIEHICFQGINVATNSALE